MAKVFAYVVLRVPRCRESLNARNVDERHAEDQSFFMRQVRKHHGNVTCHKVGHVATWDRQIEGGGIAVGSRYSSESFERLAPDDCRFPLASRLSHAVCNEGGIEKEDRGEHKIG